MSTSAPTIRGDFAELLKGGFKIFDDLLGEHIAIGEIVGFFEAFVSQPENIQAGFVTVEEFFTVIRALC